jgi:hypothetical protein
VFVRALAASGGASGLVHRFGVRYERSEPFIVFAADKTFIQEPTPTPA